MPVRPLIRYEPSPLLARLYQRFFDRIDVDESWARAVREAEQRGTVVYVLRNLSFVDFFALDYLTKRLELPEVRFANDLGLWVLEPMGRGWLERAPAPDRRPGRRGPPADHLDRRLRGALLEAPRAPPRARAERGALPLRAVAPFVRPRGPAAGHHGGRRLDSHALRPPARAGQAHPPRAPGLRVVGAAGRAAAERGRRHLRPARVAGEPPHHRAVSRRPAATSRCAPGSRWT